jgi:hypothetical protein
MIKTIIVALVLCLIEFLVIVIASPFAKSSFVLHFLPEDVRFAVLGGIIWLGIDGIKTEASITRIR